MIQGDPPARRAIQPRRFGDDDASLRALSHLYREHGSIRALVEETGQPYTTLQRRLSRASYKGYVTLRPRGGGHEE